MDLLPTGNIRKICQAMFSVATIYVVFAVASEGKGLLDFLDSCISILYRYERVLSDIERMTTVDALLKYPPSVNVNLTIDQLRYDRADTNILAAKKVFFHKIVTQRNPVLASSELIVSRTQELALIMFDLLVSVKFTGSFVDAIDVLRDFIANHDQEIEDLQKCWYAGDIIELFKKHKMPTKHMIDTSDSGLIASYKREFIQFLIKQ